MQQAILHRLPRPGYISSPDQQPTTLLQDVSSQTRLYRHILPSLLCLHRPPTIASHLTLAAPLPDSLVVPPGRHMMATALPEVAMRYTTTPTLVLPFQAVLDQRMAWECMFKDQDTALTLLHPALNTLRLLTIMRHSHPILLRPRQGTLTMPSHMDTKHHLSYRTRVTLYLQVHLGDSIILLHHMHKRIQVVLANTNSIILIIILHPDHPAVHFHYLNIIVAQLQVKVQADQAITAEHPHLLQDTEDLMI